MKAKMTDSSATRLIPLLFEMGRLMKRELSQENLMTQSWLHLETLRFIAEAGKPQMSEVAAYLKVAAPTATTLVETLVREGFITRRQDTKDRRRVLLSVSAKGKKCLTDATAKRTRAFRRVIAPLSAHDRSEFARLLDIIIRTA